MKNILITNGIIHTSDKVFKGDILIKNGRIDQISQEIQASPELMILDAKDKLIFPAGIDPHVHMELPTPAGNSSDDFYSGSRAAISGGTTSFIDFVTPGRGESLVSAFKEREKLARKSLIDYAFHVSPTWWGNDSSQEMEIMVKEFGVTSFKCYTAYQNTVGINDRVLQDVMKTARKLKALVTLHCEDDSMIQKNITDFISQGKASPKFHPLSRPAEAEFMAVQKAIEMAAKTGCKIYIVHVSTAGAIDLIRKAQKASLEVYAETCPQYLLLDDRVYDRPFEKSAPFVISPPLRKKEDQEALWEAISDGTIQTLGTDHCPFNLKGQKDIGLKNFSLIPNGAGGVEHRLSLLYTYGVLGKRISMKQFIQVTSRNPAAIFGIKNKGKIQTGFDADLVIWDPEKESVISTKTHFQNCDSNVYEGMKIKGKPEITICKGKIAFKEGIIYEGELSGNYLNRSVN
jgi:dihydropyrimidinase